MLRESKVDVSIHVNYNHSGGAASGKFIVDGANAVGSLVTRSTVPWNITVPTDGIIGARILADVGVAFQVEQKRGVVDFAGIFPLKFGRKNCFGQMHSLWWGKHLKIRPGWSQRRRWLNHARKTIGTCRATDNTTLAYNTS